MKKTRRAKRRLLNENCIKKAPRAAAVPAEKRSNGFLKSFTLRRLDNAASITASAKGRKSQLFDRKSDATPRLSASGL
jgi:hypothetical protein